MAVSDFRVLEFEVEVKRPKHWLLTGVLAGFSFMCLAFWQYRDPLLPFVCFATNLVCCITGSGKAVKVLKSGPSGRVLALLFAVVPLVNCLYALVLVRRLQRAAQVMAERAKPGMAKPPKIPIFARIPVHPTVPIQPWEEAVDMTILTASATKKPAQKQGGGNLILVALLFAVLASFAIWDGLSKIAFAKRCTATTPALLDYAYTIVERKKFFVTVSKTYRVNYRFFANGEEFTGRDFLDEEPRSREVTVHFNPRQPDENRIELGRDYLAAFVMAAIFGGLSGLALFRIVKPTTSPDDTELASLTTPSKLDDAQANRLKLGVWLSMILLAVCLLFGARQLAQEYSRKPLAPTAEVKSGVSYVADARQTMGRARIAALKLLKQMRVIDAAELQLALCDAAASDIAQAYEALAVPRRSTDLPTELRAGSGQCRKLVPYATTLVERDAAGTLPVLKRIVANLAASDMTSGFGDSLFAAEMLALEKLNRSNSAEMFEALHDALPLLWISNLPERRGDKLQRLQQAWSLAVSLEPPVPLQQATDIVNQLGQGYDMVKDPAAQIQLYDQWVDMAEARSTLRNPRLAALLRSGLSHYYSGDVARLQSIADRMREIYIGSPDSTEDETLSFYDGSVADAMFWAVYFYRTYAFQFDALDQVQAPIAVLVQRMEEVYGHDNQFVNAARYHQQEVASGRRIDGWPGGTYLPH